MERGETTTHEKPGPRRGNNEAIRQIAYHLWLDEGCPEGRHHEHWFKAEEIWHARQEITLPNKVQLTRASKKPAMPQAKKPAAKVKARSPKRLSTEPQEL